MLRLLLALFAIAIADERVLQRPQRLGDPASVAGCQAYYRTLGQNLAVDFRAQGPRVLLKAEGATRELKDIGELKVGTYNTLNLEYQGGKVVYNPRTGQRELTAPAREKPAWQQAGLAKTIKSKDSDILFLEEVENVEALKRFVANHLDDKYKLILIEGNDDRGIDVAMLVKKDLPFDIEVQSFRNIKFRDEKKGVESLLFSRDLPVMHLRRKGAGDQGEPLMSFMGTHFKSQRDGPGDPQSVYRRSMQVRETARIMTELRTKNPNAPVVLLGDFNADVRTAQEFQPLKTAGFQDAFDLAPNSIPKEQRVSHSFHPRNQPTVYSQLDTMMVADRDARQLVNQMEVVPYLDEQGRVKPLPRTYKEREQNPSDHMMVQGVFNFRKILERAGIH